MVVPFRGALGKFAAVALAIAIAGCASDDAAFVANSDGRTTSLESVIKAGERARSDGDLVSAEAFFKQATAVNPKSTEGWLRLGAVQVLSKEFIPATQSYRAAQALDPSNVEAAYALGELALLQASPADALDEIKAGLRWHPDDPQLNYLAWIVYTRLGQPEIARQYYRIALIQNSSHLLPRDSSKPSRAPAEESVRESDPTPSPELRIQSVGLATASAIHPPPVVAAQPTVSDQPIAAPVYRLQLGSERSEADAQAEWQRLRARHPDVLGDVSLTVEKADLGAKGLYYRIQAGPIGDAEQAHGRCAELLGKKTECLVVRSP